MAGLAVMPEGGRRLALKAAARAIFEEDFDGRVLPFDTAAAAAYADILAARRRDGHPAAPLDLMIAAAAVVTRDTSGFEGCGVPLTNPWHAS
jgi:toxin FitB